MFLFLQNILSAGHLLRLPLKIINRFCFDIIYKLIKIFDLVSKLPTIPSYQIY